VNGYTKRSNSCDFGLARVAGQAGETLVDFEAIDANGRRGFDPESDPVSPDVDHDDPDVATDYDFLSVLACENEHRNPSVAGGANALARKPGDSQRAALRGLMWTQV